MPQVVNGFGTWYWGRRNVFIRRGVCVEVGVGLADGCSIARGTQITDLPRRAPG